MRTALLLLGALGFGILLIPRRRYPISELPAWIIADIKRQEKQRREERPCITIPLPEDAPEEEEPVVIDLNDED